MALCFFGAFILLLRYMHFYRQETPLKLAIETCIRRTAETWKSSWKKPTRRCTAPSSSGAIKWWRLGIATKASVEATLSSARLRAPRLRGFRAMRRKPLPEPMSQQRQPEAGPDQHRYIAQHRDTGAERGHARGLSQK